MGVVLSCAPPSEESRIHVLVEKLCTWAEDKKLDLVLDQISPEFVDFEGREKDEIKTLISDYFQRFGGIVIHLLSTRIDYFEVEARAEVRAEIVFSSGAAEVLRRLVRYGGEYFRFRLELERDLEKKWKIAYAEWNAIDLGDLFPESQKANEELFPERKRKDN